MRIRFDLGALHGVDRSYIAHLVEGNQVCLQYRVVDCEVIANAPVIGMGDRGPTVEIHTFSEYRRAKITALPRPPESLIQGRRLTSTDIQRPRNELRISPRNMPYGATAMLRGSLGYSLVGPTGQGTFELGGIRIDFESGWSVID